MEQPQISFNPSQQRILEEIKQLGFESENKQLIEFGFTKLTQNRKYLKEFQGNLDVILSILLEKADEKRKSQPNDIEDEKSDNRGDKIPKEKIKKERKNDIILKEFNEWPADINTVYLDGNNMLYVEDAIRQKSIGRGKGKAEQMLSDLAKSFCEASTTPHLILVFDHTKTKSVQNIIVNGKTLKFEVTSASPSFQNSDDALVEWSSKLGDQAGKSLFVTSDRELQRGLQANGIENIMKPKKWFGFTKSFIGEEKYADLLKKTNDKLLEA